MTEPTTTIYMTIMEQEQYVRMMKYYNVVIELDRIDFYSMKNCRVEINKDRDGNLSAVNYTIHKQLR